MCIVEPEKLTNLHDLQQKHDFHIHIAGVTNELQHNFIQQGISNAPHNPNMTYTLSYELGTLDKGQLKHYVENILRAQDYEPVWHMDDQKEYEQNALEILGNYYDEISS